MGTKNDPGEFDCYANAEPDEPMFVLLARDERAAQVVEYWAHLHSLTSANAEKTTEALQCAVAMREWRNRLPRSGVDGDVPVVDRLVALCDDWGDGVSPECSAFADEIRAALSPVAMEPL